MFERTRDGDVFVLRMTNDQNLMDAKLVRLLGAKLPPATVRTAVLSEYPFRGPEALEAGWVDALAAESDLMATATRQAHALAGKPRRIYGSVKWATWGALAAELGHERRRGG